MMIDSRFEVADPTAGRTVKTMSPNHKLTLGEVNRGYLIRHHRGAYGSPDSILSPSPA